MPQISANAIVEPTAKVADDAVIGPFSYVGPHVHIAPGCVIDNNVTIVGRTTLGSRTRVFPLAVIGASPAHGRRDAKCVLGEANAIREHVTIYGGVEAPTRIGNHNLIMIASQVGPGATIGDHGIFDNCSKIGAAAIIEDYVRMSGFTSVADGATVGAYSFIAGYSGVKADAPYAMLQGYPVRVRGANSRNLKACGFGEEDIHALKSAFRELFNGPANEVNAEALERLGAAEGLNPHVLRLVEAVSPARAAGDRRDD